MKRYDKRPWGGFEIFSLNKKSTVKILTIKPKQRFSLQYHKYRDELWVFLDNSARVTLGKKIFNAKKGDEIHVNRKQAHRIQAFSKPVSILEISFGKFYEDDIVRLEDDYGRI